MRKINQRKRRRVPFGEEYVSEDELLTGERIPEVSIEETVCSQNEGPTIEEIQFGEDLMGGGECEPEPQIEEPLSEVDPLDLKFEGIIKKGNAQMKAEDFRSLSEGHFLEGKVIFFFMEYLKCVVYSEKRNTIEILDPCFVEYYLSPEAEEESQDAKDKLDALKLCDKKIVLAAVNDCNNWSLLTFIPTANRFYHIDSISGMNSAKAKKLASIISGTEHDFSEKKFGEILECDSGLQVIVNAEKVIFQVLMSGKSMNEPLCDVTVSGMSMRKELVKIAQSCADSQSQ